MSARGGGVESANQLSGQGAAAASAHTRFGRSLGLVEWGQVADANVRHQAVATRPAPAAADEKKEAMIFRRGR